MEYSNEQLAMMVKAGDQAAAALLWEQVRRFVFRFMSRYFKMGMERRVDQEDFLQEGYIAMMEAVRYYDPEKGYTFITYMTNTLRRAGQRALNMKGGKVSPPVDSLDEPIPGTGSRGEPVYLVESIEDTSAWADMERVELDWYRGQLRCVLLSCMDEIKPGGLEVLKARYLEAKTLQQIGDELGLTRQAVSLREQAALKVLRRHLSELEPFMHPWRGIEGRAHE